MTRPIFLTAAALLLLVSHAVSQRDFSKVQFKTVHVAGNIHMLDSGVAGNIGLLVGDDGILMIDDQFAPLAPKIRAATAKISDAKLKFLVNTHWHGDHTGEATVSSGRKRRSWPIPTSASAYPSNNRERRCPW